MYIYRRLCNICEFCNLILIINKSMIYVLMYFRVTRTRGDEKKENRELETLGGNA